MTDDVEWVFWEGWRFPIAKTRRHRIMARKISFEIFVKKTRNRDEIDIPHSIEIEGFLTYYLKKLERAGLITIKEDGIQVKPEVQEQVINVNALLKRIHKELSIREMAELFDVPISTVRAWLYYSSTPSSPEIVERIITLATGRDTK